MGSHVPQGLGLVPAAGRQSAACILQVPMLLTMLHMALIMEPCESHQLDRLMGMRAVCTNALPHCSVRGEATCSYAVMHDSRRWPPIANLGHWSFSRVVRKTPCTAGSLATLASLQCRDCYISWQHHYVRYGRLAVRARIAWWVIELWSEQHIPAIRATLRCAQPRDLRRCFPWVCIRLLLPGRRAVVNMDVARPWPPCSRSNAALRHSNLGLALLTKSLHTGVITNPWKAGAHA